MLTPHPLTSSIAGKRGNMKMEREMEMEMEMEIEIEMEMEMWRTTR